MPSITGVAAYQARIAAEKRGSILDAAVEVFLANGYERTTLAQIAKAAAVSTGTLFNHFPTKAHLFGALMARVWENEPGDEGDLPVPGNPIDGLRLIGMAYARLLRMPRMVPLFRLIVAEAPRFPELGEELYRRGKAPYLDRLQRYLLAEQLAGTLVVPPEDVPRATRELLGMINDQLFWPHLLIVDLSVDDKEVRQVVESAVRTFWARYGTTPAVQLPSEK